MSSELVLLTASDPAVELLEQLPLAALTGGLLMLLVATLVFNRGDPWVVNVLATDEPFLVALGTTMFLLGAGMSVAGFALTEVLGLALIVLGLASRFTGLTNINEVVG